MNQVIFDPINLLFTVPMVVLAAIDFFSQFTETHKDFKNTIVGLGILGTFGGIFFGLQAFDPNKIQESIPPLLEGLKTAFWTSIAGMTISMVLTVIETMFVKKTTLGNEFDVLLEIDKNGKNLTSNLSNFQMQQNQGLLNIETAINKNFIPLQETLNKAFEKISEGATKEIIKALENVIQDFNKNLTDQFGDNFKALNEAVKNMITWQENYRNNIEDMQRGLNAAITAIQASETSLVAIASKNEEVLVVYKNLEAIVKTMDAQMSQINGALGNQTRLFEQASNSLGAAEAKLVSFSEKASASVAKMEETVSSATKATSGIITSSSSELSRKVEEVSSKVASENAKLFDLTMKNFAETKKTIDDLTEKFRTSLGSQSEAISKLNDEIKKQLPESLKSLGSALTTLTGQFKTDYEFFLSKIRELTSDLHRK